MGGKNTPDNKVRVCDTGHYNIHRIMAVLYRRSLSVTKERVPGTPMERALAMQGLAGWGADGKPGHFVFEDHVHMTGVSE